MAGVPVGGGDGDGQRHGKCVSVVSGEGTFAHYHFVHDRAERKDITAGIGGMALQDFGGGVGRDRFGPIRREDQLQAGVVNGDVRRREDAAITSFVVKLAESLGQQGGITQSLRYGKWSFGQTLAES